jgi:hypothetical protein
VPATQHVAPRAGQLPQPRRHPLELAGAESVQVEGSEWEAGAGDPRPKRPLRRLGAYLVGYGLIGPWVFNQQDASLNFMARAAARERENQGRPNPGEPCKTETGGGGGRARIPPAVAAAADEPEPAGRLHSTGPNTWKSSGGLVYGPDNFYGNRVQHVLAHTAPDPGKPMHSVFNVGRSRVLGLVDEAWSMRGASATGDQGAFVVPMGRVVGTAGETAVRIIVRPGTNQIITAYPVVP